MTIHWKALKEHFLVVPFIFLFKHLLRGKMHFLHFSPKDLVLKDIIRCGNNLLICDGQVNCDITKIYLCFKECNKIAACTWQTCLTSCRSCEHGAWCMAPGSHIEVSYKHFLSIYLVNFMPIFSIPCISIVTCHLSITSCYF
jgi:hypothetical protein